MSEDYKMSKNEVLSLVDGIMHEFASSYRSEAKQRVEERFASMLPKDEPALDKCEPVLDCNKCDSLGKLFSRCGPGTGVRC